LIVLFKKFFKVTENEQDSTRGQNSGRSVGQVLETPCQTASLTPIDAPARILELLMKRLNGGCGARTQPD
jgi:hypothetical protein